MDLPPLIPDFLESFVYVIAFAKHIFIINVGSIHFSLYDFWVVCAIMSVLWWFFCRVIGIEMSGVGREIDDDFWNLG